MAQIFYTADNMATDVLATKGAGISHAMTLVYFARNKPISA